MKSCFQLVVHTSLKDIFTSAVVRVQTQRRALGHNLISSTTKSSAVTTDKTNRPGHVH